MNKGGNNASCTFIIPPLMSVFWQLGINKKSPTKGTFCLLFHFEGNFVERTRPTARSAYGFIIPYFFQKNFLVSGRLIWFQIIKPIEITVVIADTSSTAVSCPRFTPSKDRIKTTIPAAFLDIFISTQNY